jgi:hypothetical protein
MNGQILINDKEEVKNPTWLLPNQVSTHYLKPKNLPHKIEILGDSHLIGVAASITNNMGKKYEVCSLTQPGAAMTQIVDSQEEILKNLGKNYAIVINGGSNDIHTINGKVNVIQKSMVHFIQNYSNTNIVLITIPHRYDLQMHDKRNLSIQAYNCKLKNISNIFHHVTLVETSLEWRFFTKHGFHLNKTGKEWLAKL